MAWVLSLLLLALTAHAVPASFTYQGTLTDASDVPIASTSKNVIFTIYDPSGSCLLYQESQTVTTDPNGVFSVQVGSAVGSGVRAGTLDPGLTMATVFKSQALSVVRAAGANCAAGYTVGTSGSDQRRLRISIGAIGSATDLSPDVFMTSVPFALQAENAVSLGDLGKVSFFRSSSTSAPDLNAAGVANLSFLAAPPCAAGDLPKFDGTNWICVSFPAGGVSSVAAGQGLAGGTITTTGTLALASIANNALLANTSGAAAAPSATTLTALIDASVSTTQGSLLYRGGAGWVALGPGTSGQLLQTSGAGANPVWTNPVSAVTLTGDVSGSSAANTVDKIKGVAVSAAPTSAGQILRYNGTQFVPNFISMFDLRSTVTGSAAFGGVGCLANQTLTWTAATDDLACTNISLSAGQITGNLPVAHGGIGTTSLAPTFVLNGGQTGAVTLGSSDANAVTVKTNGQARVLVDASGNVGIGSAAPQVALDVNGEVRAKASIGYASALFPPASSATLPPHVSGSGAVIDSSLHADVAVLTNDLVLVEANCNMSTPSDGELVMTMVVSGVTGTVVMPISDARMSAVGTSILRPVHVAGIFKSSQAGTLVATPRYKNLSGSNNGSANNCNVFAQILGR